MPLLVGAMVGLAACSAGPDVPDRAAADAPRRTTSTTAPAPPGLERVGADPAGFDGAGDSRFTGVAVGRRGIVVIGEDAGGAATWITADGVDFEPVPLDPAAFPPGTELVDVVVTTDGFVVVGSAAGRATAWVSPDGRSWVAAPLVDGEAADVVVVGELGLTAFGRSAGAVSVWHSFDGTAWERVAGGARVFDRDGDARVVGAYDDGDGFVALLDRGGVAELWRSPDGRTWEPEPEEGAELLPADGPPRPTTLLGTGSTVIVLGAVDDPDGVDGAVWVSVEAAPFERSSPSEEVFGGDGAQVVTAAVQLGADLVAVGIDTDIEGDVDVVLWSTGSGGGWRRSPVSEGDGLSGPGDQLVADIAPTREGALAVGWESDRSGTRAVAWSLVDDTDPPEPTSGEGEVLVWQRVPYAADLGGPGPQQLDAVVAATDGFTAVGSSVRPDDPGGDVDGAAWRSDDGVEWERDGSTADALGGPGDQALSDVVAVGGGGAGLVAVGRDQGSAAVWERLPGGRGWERAAGGEEVFGGPGEQVANAVVVAPDGSLVAVGADGGGEGGDGAVWRSGDGRTWMRVTGVDALGGPGAQALTGVTVVGPLLVAVGSSDAAAVAWTSADGTTWDRAELGPGDVQAVTATGAGAVAVGSATRDDGTLDAMAWRSTDGRIWTPAPIDDGSLAAADQQILDVTTAVDATDAEVVAGVGWTDLGPGDDGASWASGDGAAWTRAPHDEDVYGGDQAQRMEGVGADAEVAVAVGWSGSSQDRDAAVWVTVAAGGGGGVL